MQIRRWLLGAIVGTLVVLALAPAAAQAAAGPPEVTSVSPNEFGSGGATKINIHGRNFEEVSAVHFGVVAATKIITTGVPTKGQCKVKSTGEIECLAPFHECGHFHVTVTNPLGTSEEGPSNEITIPCEIYRNEVAVGASHIPLLGYGQIDLTSSQIQSTFECVNLGFGSGWNESGRGHGEILVWWTSGHTPMAEHTELSSRCRFIYHGIEENQPSSPMAWASAEPPLKLVNQEGVVCAESRKRELSSCPLEAERVHETVTREVFREKLSVPWNIAFTEREGKRRTIIGLPDVCKPVGETEKIIPTECPEPSEHEIGPPEKCNIPPSPAPGGCVRVAVDSNPPLNIHMEYEGYVEPISLNAGPNGLSPSEWEFEGHEKGEPALHLRESPSTEGSTTGFLKILGYASQELISVK